MRFWEISAPGYTSDYQESNINGSIEDALILPSVDCDLCRMTWGWSGLRSLPFECPESLRNEMRTMDRRRSLPREEHRRLQENVLELANAEGEPYIDVGPGYRFPPLFFDVPSRPRADFLWPFGGLLVSGRIRDLFVDLCRDDVVTLGVILRKVGRRNARLPAHIPISGEPEDIINDAPLLDDPSVIGPYYEVIPRHASNEPPDRIIEFRCTACGWVKAKVVQTLRERRKPRMAEDTWRGHSIFYLGGTLHIVVTDKVRKALQSVRPSNLQLTEVLSS